LLNVGEFLPLFATNFVSKRGFLGEKASLFYFFLFHTPISVLWKAVDKPLSFVDIVYVSMWKVQIGTYQQ